MFETGCGCRAAVIFGMAMCWVSVGCGGVEGEQHGARVLLAGPSRVSPLLGPHRYVMVEVDRRIHDAFALSDSFEIAGLRDRRDGGQAVRTQVVGEESRRLAMSTGTFSLAGLSSRGTLAGTEAWYRRGSFGFVLPPHGDRIDLGRADVLGLNDRDETVGAVDVPAADGAYVVRAALWGARGAQTLLPVALDDGTEAAESRAVDVNDGSEVVGQLDGGTVFLWRRGSANLSVILRETERRSWTPTAINGSGDIVGYATSGNGTRAFWRRADGTRILLDGRDCMPSDVNDAGLVVGTCGAGEPRAVLWRPEVSTEAEDLNAWLPVGSGWRLDQAEAVNGAGAIVCGGVVESRRAAVVFIPKGRVWGFRRDGETAGWRLARGLVGHSHAGVLRLTVTEKNPRLESPHHLDMASRYYRQVRVRMRNRTAGDRGALYFTTNLDPQFTKSKRVRFPVQPRDDTLRDYLVSFADHPSWRGSISQLRLVPVENASCGRVDIDAIRFQP